MASGTTFTLREPNSLARLLWMVRAMTSSYQVKEGSKKSQKLKSDSYYWDLMVEKKFCKFFCKKMFDYLYFKFLFLEPTLTEKHFFFPVNDVFILANF